MVLSKVRRLFHKKTVKKPVYKWKKPSSSPHLALKKRSPIKTAKNPVLIRMKTHKKLRENIGLPPHVLNEALDKMLMQKKQREKIGPPPPAVKKFYEIPDNKRYNMFNPLATTPDVRDFADEKLHQKRLAEAKKFLLKPHNPAGYRIAKKRRLFSSTPKSKNKHNKTHRRAKAPSSGEVSSPGVQMVFNKKVHSASPMAHYKRLAHPILTPVSFGPQLSSKRGVIRKASSTGYHSKWGSFAKKASAHRRSLKKEAKWNARPLRNISPLPKHKDILFNAPIERMLKSKKIEANKRNLKHLFETITKAKIPSSPKPVTPVSFGPKLSSSVKRKINMDKVKTKKWSDKPLKQSSSVKTDEFLKSKSV